MSQEEKIQSVIRARPELGFIADFLTAYPHAQLYLVGGAARDTLLGRPTKDFDFVVRGLPALAIEAWFGKRGRISLVGEPFGVYKFLPTGFSGRQIEEIDIALPRTESPTKNSRGSYRDFIVQSDASLPIKDDLKRRDFTINAMAYDLRADKLIDPFHGQKDLASKTIRAVGDARKRFKEDLTRVLRGIRFAAQLRFDIEPKTLKAMERATKDIPEVVPREMIAAELAKAITADPSRAIHLLAHTNALEALGLPADKLSLASITRAKPNELTLVMALLLRGLPETEARAAIEGFGIDTKETLWLARTLRERLTPQDIDRMSASTFENNFMGRLGLLRTRGLELLGEASLAWAIVRRRKSIEGRWLVDETESIAPLLSGHDLLAHGVTAGPEVRRILTRLRDEQLDGRLLTREAALRWLKKQS